MVWVLYLCNRTQHCRLFSFNLKEPCKYLHIFSTQPLSLFTVLDFTFNAGTWSPCYLCKILFPGVSFLFFVTHPESVPCSNLLTWAFVYYQCCVRICFFIPMNINNFSLHSFIIFLNTGKKIVTFFLACKAWRLTRVPLNFTSPPPLH